MRNLLPISSYNNKPKINLKLVIIFASGLVLFWVSRQPWFPIKINFQAIYLTSVSGKKESASFNNGYYAVYLSNNQVYFGRIVNDQDPYLVMTDIYYFRQRNLPAEDKVQLIKLGNELHGPEDKIYFNKSQVAFTQQLKEDSQIVKAMIKYQEEKSK